MTQDEAIRLALDYDKVTARTLSRREQGAEQDAVQDLEALLNDLGCDPDAPNCLALTYNSVRKAQQALDAVREAYFN